MATLTGMSEEVKGTHVEVADDKITIGRGSDNTILVDNSSVSSYHCEVYKEGQVYRVKDLGSTNGTRVNNKGITEYKLRPKDILQVGSAEFMFDAAPGEVPLDKPSQTTQVEVAEGTASVPSSFASVSPFKTRRSDSKALWLVAIIVLALGALGAIIWLFIELSS